jgi:hypothetical protein
MIYGKANVLVLKTILELIQENRNIELFGQNN